MAVVLAATGIFIRERLASNLDQAVDRALRARAADVAALAQQSDSGLIDARGARPSETVKQGAHVSGQAAAAAPSVSPLGGGGQTRTFRM